MNQHGGHRTPGPGKKLGRPPKLQDARRITVWVECWQAQRLSEMDDQSKFIRNLLTQYFERMNQNE